MTDPGGAASPRTEAGKRLLANMTASDGWGDATYGVRLRTNPEEWRAVILAIEDEAAGLPPEWVWERRPGDDAECERLGCEDRTHPVQHVRLRAAQEAPAPEGLTVYAVVFSNYESAEVNSLWRRREDADARCAELMAGKGAWGWEVQSWAVK